MNARNNIIVPKNMYLRERFLEIREQIETNAKYQDLSLICEFYPSENRLSYKTERIYPSASNYKGSIPVLFLFSNPHPVSVKTGLFLSESHSRKFWVRLFESEPNIGLDLKKWNNSTPKMLGDMMLQGKYESRFIIYFHCLYPIPTNQLADLYGLFGKGTDLWRQIEKDSLKELSLLLENESINHVVVFTSAIYQLLTDASVENVKGWRNTVKIAINNHEAGQLWSQNGQGRAKAKDKELFSENIDFYHALDTHAKNWGKEMDKRYFASALDKIFENIL